VARGLAMATAEAPAKLSRGEWVSLTDEDSGKLLFYAITNVLERGTKIMCKASCGL